MHSMHMEPYDGVNSMRFHAWEHDILAQSWKGKAKFRGKLKFRSSEFDRVLFNRKTSTAVRHGRM